MPEQPGDEEPSEPSEEGAPETGTGEKPAEREARKRYLKLAEFGLPESPYDTLKIILRAMRKLGGSGTQLTIQHTTTLSSKTAPHTKQ